MSITQYSEFNTPLNTIPETLFITEELLIERAGGKENYELIKSTGLATTDKELYEFTGFLSSINFNRTLLIEVSAGIISPIAKQLGMVKGSIFWYMFTYGIVHAIEQLGTDILDDSKEANFCSAFSAGIAGSMKYWLSDKIFIKILKFLGLPVSTSFLSSGIYHNIQDQILNPKMVHEAVNGVICGENFEIDGEKLSLFGMVYKYASDGLSSLYDKYFS